MFDQRRIRQDFSRAAAQYDAHALLQQRVLARLFGRVDPFIAPDARILDAGCGTGQFAHILKRRDVVQVDVSAAMCAEASRHSEWVACADMAVLPFADGCFDAVFSSLALQWLPNVQAGLREFERVVKPGGVVAVSTFGASTLRELRASFAEVDDYPHVSPFIRPDISWQKETVTEYFPDLRAIMQGLKAIGAGNKLAGRRKAMMPRGLMAQAEQFYREHFGADAGLPVTWEVLYRVERK